MKKIIYFLLAVLALASCTTQKVEPVVPSDELVDLRYRVKDSYDLAATNPEAFNIIVKSTQPWTIRSVHPTWCMIEKEEGEAVPDSLVHVGKGENTTVKIQYYSNFHLDDRVDTLIIASSYWVGKRVIVNQKGIAYLNVDEAERALDMDKAGSEVSFHIQSNQDWTVQAESGSDWLQFKQADGSFGATASGSKDGVVTLKGPDNSGEMRYGHMNVFDRNGKKMKWQIVVTQDGVQLEPVAIEVLNEDTMQNDLEIRGDWNQGVLTMPVRSNTTWKVVKKNAADTWFDLLEGTGSGDGNVRIQMQNNAGEAIREGFIVISTVSSDPAAVAVSKEVKVRQAYESKPTRYLLSDPDVFALWPDSKNTSNGYVNPPQLVENGMLLVQNTQVRRTSMPFAGTYTFHWVEIGAGARVRMWLYLKGSSTIKYNLYQGKTDISGFSGLSNGSYDASATTHDVTVQATPANDGYCHVAFLLDGKEVTSYTSDEKNEPTLTWGVSVDQFYLAVDKGDSAILAWYEYTAPFSWE